MSSPPNPLPTNIYKILDAAPPSPLPDILPSTPLDTQDGFIHLSSGGQVSVTANLYFSNQSTLWLLELPLAPLQDGKGTVKWEGPRGCAHLYDAPIGTKEVSRVIVVERNEGEKWDSVMSKQGLH